MDQQPKVGDLRVWHYCQVGAVPVFHVPVASIQEAAKIVRTLRKYDLFQYDNKVKPDYASATGLEVFGDLGDSETPELTWYEWDDDESGYDISDMMEMGNV